MPHDSLPLTALSRRMEERLPLHFPEYSVIRDVEIGGPKDATDRRLILDVATLDHLLQLARQSPTGRVVVHSPGLRVRLLEEVDTKARWELLTILGREPVPELSGFWRGLS